MICGLLAKLDVQVVGVRGLPSVILKWGVG
jgi:hypothetical protein